MTRADPAGLAAPGARTPGSRIRCSTLPSGYLTGVQVMGILEEP